MLSPPPARSERNGHNSHGEKARNIMQLKLVTLNIWDIPFWFSLDREARLARLGQYLNKISPDLICLQESFDVKHRDDLYEYFGPRSISQYRSVRPNQTRASF
jgi:endonuclease/exonuclease/phosphatase family metal-dependent hydrolase